MWKRIGILAGDAAAIALPFALLVSGMFVEARRDPLVRRAEVALPGWPAGAPPVRLVLLSDVHAGTASVTPARLARIVAMVEALHPDLILIAGDFLPGHDPIGADRARELLAPLAGLHARLGVIAVPGNHDHWTGLGAIRAALEKYGITLLANQAVTRGPLAIGAVDDDFSGYDDVARTVEAVRRLPGARLLLTHSPDIAPGLPGDFPLLLAGHTHCGQVVVPGYGSVDPVTRYGARYECGAVREGGRLTIVTGGIGTSGGPFRFNAPPDIWLVTLGPSPRRP